MVILFGAYTHSVSRFKERVIFLLIAPVVAIGLFFFVHPVSAETNLLANPGAETGNTTGWTITPGQCVANQFYVPDSNTNCIDAYGGGRTGDFAFYSSYNWGVISQEIDLLDEGYSAGTLDAEPTITASVYVSGPDDFYQFQVELRDENHDPIATYDTGELTSTGGWTLVTTDFEDYGAGVRYVYFKLRGKDQEFWQGHFGSVFDDASLTVEDIAPILAEATPIATPANDSTPTYVFTSTEAGDITYGGSCTSATVEAVVGENTIVLSTLADGSYTNCTITVTDDTDNESIALAVSSFQIDATAPVLTIAAEIPSISTANPSIFRFESSETGTPILSDCNAGSQAADVVAGTVTLDGLIHQQTYACTLQVRDAVGNTSNTLQIGGFKFVVPSGGGWIGLPLRISPPPATEPVIVAETIEQPPVESTTPPEQTSLLATLKPTAYQFTRTLRVRSVGADVKQLQIFLNTHGFPLASLGFGSQGNETTYFGTSTRNALVKFQEAHASDILTPLGLRRGTGLFGAATLKLVNAILTSETSH